MFKRISIYAITGALSMFSCVQAQEVSLKKSFWSGWQYSTDGAHYEKVGNSANSLRMIMSENDEAMSELDSYKSNKTLSLVTGVPGGALVGWPLGATLGGGPWEPEYTYMLAIGGTLGVISLVAEGSATRHLKKAVDVHNGFDQPTLERFDIRFGYLPAQKSFGATISFSL